MIYKYGGFYSDIDAVTIKDLSRFKNVFGALKAHHMPNGDFHLERHHPILQLAMERVIKTFKGKKRTEIGPLFGSTIVV